MKIHVGSLDTRTGVYHFASRTAEGLLAKMAAHVRERLASEGERGELALLQSADVLKRYVELRGGDDVDEWYDTSEVELEGAAPAAEGRVRGSKPRLLERFRPRAPAKGKEATHAA